MHRWPSEGSMAVLPALTVTHQQRHTLLHQTETKVRIVPLMSAKARRRV